ncbi:hypothetical protein Bpfe_016395 [Biomphalaria pfeifferi]|uniref:Uncharacterized protein n=1 Tax=Biomphalaria pfeifferi TaxID=112525 RepID=A0AAD8BHL9_BIOPF|nr:hypothetical protein Bpfe_016395 [Biomphalaria pfeifferi]
MWGAASSLVHEVVFNNVDVKGLTSAYKMPACVSKCLCECVFQKGKEQDANEVNFDKVPMHPAISHALLGHPGKIKYIPKRDKATIGGPLHFYSRLLRVIKQRHDLRHRSNVIPLGGAAL